LYVLFLVLYLPLSNCINVLLRFLYFLSFLSEYPNALYSELPDVGARTVGRIKNISLHLSCCSGCHVLGARFITALKFILHVAVTMQNPAENWSTKLHIQDMTHLHLAQCTF
jgi:hypothetical protein